MQVFDPILRWAEAELGATLVAGDSLIGMDQSEQLISKARSYLHGKSTAAPSSTGAIRDARAVPCHLKRARAPDKQYAHCGGGLCLHRAGPVAAGSGGSCSISVSVCDSWAGACQGKAAQCHNMSP